MGASVLADSGILLRGSAFRRYSLFHICLRLSTGSFCCSPRGGVPDHSRERDIAALSSYVVLVIIFSTYIRRTDGRTFCGFLLLPIVAPAQAFFLHGVVASAIRVLAARRCNFCCPGLASACCCGFAAQALSLPICLVLLRVAPALGAFFLPPLASSRLLG